jgi:hypothetical protein
VAIYTSNQARIALKVPGVTIDNLSWDKFEGGERSADTQNYNPGGMKSAIATGGASKRAQATLTRAWDDTLIGAYIALEAAINTVGVACSITFLSTPTTIASGKPAGFNYTGVLRSVTRPNYDSTSSTIAMLAVVLELNEVIS